MSGKIVKDLIDNCSLEDLANDPSKQKGFAELLKAAKSAGFDPIRVEEVKNTNGVICLEIVYEV
jgi:hypothetical protein